jgi:putative flippase GtrA
MRPAADSHSVRRELTRELVAFCCVGLLALATHFVVVTMLVGAGLHPLLANVFGFCVAFSVSFLGHDRWTFPARGRARARALYRFFVVAVGGFLINETTYALVLRFTALDYRSGLLIALALAATTTLLASRHWAFAHERS